MKTANHRALRILLGIICLLTTLGGVVMILGNRTLISWMFMHPPTSEISVLLLAVIKEMGGVLLMISLMLFFVVRDPVRHVAIIDAIIFGVCVLAVTPLLSLYTLDLGRLYPGYLIWGRSILRLVFAALLLWLRPGGVPAIES